MRKRKFALRKLVLLIAIMIFNSPAMAVPTVSLQPSTTAPTVGSSFNVLVNIASVTDLFGYQFDVQFNPTILAATGITEGLFLPSGGTTFFIPGAIDNTAGSVTFTSDALIGALAGVNGSGTLATLNFLALAKGTSAVSLLNVELLDSNLADIAFSTTGTNISPTTTTTKTPEPESVTLMSFGILVMAMLQKFRARC